MSADLFENGIDLLILILSISLFICFIRLYLGPDVPNRTVAFDLISIHAVGLFGLLAARSGSFVLIEGAIVTAVLGFLGTVMLARYLERAGRSLKTTAESSPEEETSI